MHLKRYINVLDNWETNRVIIFYSINDDSIQELYSDLPMSLKSLVSVMGDKPSHSIRFRFDMVAMELLLYQLYKDNEIEMLIDWLEYIMLEAYELKILKDKHVVVYNKNIRPLSEKD